MLPKLNENEETFLALMDHGTKMFMNITEVYQTVHMKELTDFPKNDQEDPTEVFTDIHFGGRSVAHEAYHLSHGSYQ